MCKIIGYCCSFLYYAIASIGLFGVKLYVDCEGEGMSWNGCELDECQQQYMWYDLGASMIFVGPVVSTLSMVHCGFNWWKLLSFVISIAITVAQVVSVFGCCLARKRAKKSRKKK
eukprot:341440_1